MTEHLQNGAMKYPMRNIHRNNLTRTEIIKNVSCNKRLDDVKKQKIYEALIISKERPSNNRQNEEFPNILKLYY